MSKILRFNTGKDRNWYEVQNMDGREADIYIYDEIGFFGTLAEDFVAELNSIDADLLNVHINSPGGSVFEGLAIYNALRSHKALVSVHIDGLAASIASIIAMAGDEVTIADNAMLMIHKPAVLMFGQAPDLRKEADLLDKIESQLVSTYAKRSSATPEQISAWMQEEKWFTGAEAVDAGFADKISEPKKVAASLTKWDLSYFNNAPDIQEHEESNTVTPLSLLLRRQALIEKTTNPSKNDE